MASLLVKQRPDVIIAGRERVPAFAGAERISDPGAIAALLSSCSGLADKAEDDLIFELLYLETLLACQPVKSRVILEQLGELGDEVRDGLLPPGMINLVSLRRRTRHLKQNMGMVAGRMTAAMLLFFTTLPLFGQIARAQDSHSARNTFQIASAPVVRVVDANSGQGVAGVQIKSMEEQLLGVTDATGQATLSEGYMDTDLLSLEKEGYQMYLLDRSQLSSRNIVSMKPLKDAVHTAKANTNSGAATAARPTQVAVKPPTGPTGATPPRLTHEPGHAPRLEPPKAPEKPKAPEVRIPLRPKSMRNAQMPKATATPTQVAAVPKAHEASMPTMPAAHDNVLPRQVDAPMTTTAPAAVAPKAHQDSMMKPAAGRKPMVSRPVEPTATKPETASVAVPQKMPARAGAKDMDSQHGVWVTYRVKSGDTLSSLAYHHFGSATRWPEIFAANRDTVPNPHWLRVGQMLLIPQAGAGVAKVPATTASSRSYVVKPGDSLFRIAGAQLGNSLEWHKIFQLNRGHITNPRFIYPGQHLQLPG